MGTATITTDERYNKIISNMYYAVMWIALSVFIFSVFIHYYRQKNKVIGVVQTETSVMQWSSDTASWKGGWQ